MALLPHTECMTVQPVTGTGHLTHLTVLCDLHLLPLRHLGNMEVALWDPQQERTPRSIRGKQTEGNRSTLCHLHAWQLSAQESRHLRNCWRARSFGSTHSPAGEMCAQSELIPQPPEADAHHMIYKLDEPLHVTYQLRVCR